MTRILHQPSDDGMSLCRYCTVASKCEDKKLPSHFIFFLFVFANIWLYEMVEICEVKCKICIDCSYNTKFKVQK